MWGGKRQGSGRNKGIAKDWNQYKKNAKKKKLDEAAKYNKKLDTFLVKRVADNKVKDPSDIDIENNNSNLSDNIEIQVKKNQEIPVPLPYFQNGCRIIGIY